MSDSTTGVSKPAPKQPGEFATTMAAVVHAVQRWRERGQRGRIAELRRSGQAAVPREAFWTLVEQAAVPVSLERFLHAYAPVLVAASHRAGRSPGLAFRQAGITPSRVEAWLRLPREDAIAGARRLVARCESIDLVALGLTLRRWSDGDRLRVARDFYRGRTAPAAPAGSSNQGPSDE